MKTGTDVETVPASVFRKQEIYKYMGLSKLTENDWDRRFENAKICSAAEKKFKQSFERYCENFEKIREKGLGIVMAGNPGTGKTYYTTCIMNALNSSYLVYRTTLSALLEEIRNNYNRQGKGNENEDFMLERFSKAELVIFDDLGNEFLSDWGKEKMFMILNFLYENDKSMIINSNLDYTQLEEFLKINGSDKLMDRIKSKCKKYLFNWESRRKDLYKKDFEKYF